MGESTFHNYHHPPPPVARIVEAQVGRWRLLRPPRESASRAFCPVVCLSREFGSRATDLGKRIADRLGFGYWDRDLVTAIARALQADEVTIRQFDEHTQGVVEELLSVTLFGRRVLFADYGAELRRLILTVGRRGSAVILGRGAHFILEPERCLRVRLIRPLGDRAEEFRARTNMSAPVALREVRAGERERLEFMHREFGKDARDPVHYDLVLNGTSFDLDRLEGMVLMAYLAKFGELPKETQPVRAPAPAPSATP